jgi:putative DNA primase/helicase
MFGDRVRWCEARRSWLYFDGKRWKWDDRAHVVALTHQAARSIHKDAAAEPDPAKQREITKFAIASQNERRINGMLSQAKPYLAVSMSELDCDPWLFNLQNGTLDLRTGKLRPHRPENLITKIAPVPYDPHADCPRFKQFLKETLVEDVLITFVKRYFGYALTGITRERLFAVLYGSGKNGKTTLVEVIRDCLGDYATNTDTETLLLRKYQGVGNDVAALRGARFVSGAEVEKGRRLAESKVKQLTGTDTVTARHLFGEPFDFRPEFKLVLSTNNKPIIRGTDDAIWDRIRLIPFTQRFDGKRQDPKLGDKLRGELPGILALLVQGCLEWQEHGLGEPETVRSATKEYRSEMDTLAAFIEDRCVVHPSAEVAATPLYKVYTDWCAENGENRETQKRFGMQLKERDFEQFKFTSGPYKDRNGWRGIGLRSGENPPPDGASLADEQSSTKPNKQTQATHNASSTGLDAPLSGGLADDHPLQEIRIDKPNTASSVQGAEDSGGKIQNLPPENSREGHLLEKRSASSASSAPEEDGGLWESDPMCFYRGDVPADASDPDPDEPTTEGEGTVWEF